MFTVGCCITCLSLRKYVVDAVSKAAFFYMMRKSYQESFMGDILLILMGVAVGARFAEEVRKVAPILDPSVKSTPTATQEIVLRKYLCKIFRFLLDTSAQMVDLVKNTLIDVGTAAVDVLSEMTKAVGGAILKNPIVIGGLLIGAYLLFAGGDDDERKRHNSIGTA